MKLVILVDSNTKSFDSMVDLVNGKEIYIIDTEHCDEKHEYQYLLDSIRQFSKSSNEIMLGKYSGRESIIKELGDERPEMILALSSNKNNRHYSGSLVDMFLEIIKKFEEGDNIGKIL